MASDVCTWMMVCLLQTVRGPHGPVPSPLVEVVWLASWAPENERKGAQAVYAEAPA